MIRSLRVRHRRVVVGLAVLVPAVFIAGLAARRPAGKGISLPPGLQTEPATSVLLQLEGGDRLDWSVALLDPAEVEGPPRVAVTLRSDPKLPELLVYWARGGPAPAERLPDAGRLLGPLPGSGTAVFEMPLRAFVYEGQLVVYSLPHGEVIDTIDLPSIDSIPRSTPAAVPADS